VAGPSVGGTVSHAWAKCQDSWAIRKAKNGPPRHFFQIKIAGEALMLEQGGVHFRMSFGTGYAAGGVKISEDKVDFGEKLFSLWFLGAISFGLNI
jgi:hypothetical protein